MVRMSEQFVSQLSEIYRLLFVGTATCLLLYPFFVYWKIYTVYRTLDDDRARHLGFLWYSFQFQLPSLAKGMREYLDPKDFPEDAKAHVNNIQRQLRRVRMVVLLWIFIVIGFGAATALLRKFHS